MVGVVGFLMCFHKCARLWEVRPELEQLWILFPYFRWFLFPWGCEWIGLGSGVLFVKILILYPLRNFLNFIRFFFCTRWAVYPISSLEFN